MNSPGADHPPGRGQEEEGQGKVDDQRVGIGRPFGQESHEFYSLEAVAIVSTGA